MGWCPLIGLVANNSSYRRVRQEDSNRVFLVVDCGTFGGEASFSPLMMTGARLYCRVRAAVG